MAETLHAGIALDGGLSARVLRQLAHYGTDRDVGHSVALQRMEPVPARGMALGGDGWDFRQLMHGIYKLHVLGGFLEGLRGSNPISYTLQCNI